VLGAEAARTLPGVAEVVVTAEPGQWVRPAVSAFERIGYVIATGADHDAVDDVLARAAALIRVPVRPLENAVSEPELVSAG
jgi:cysteine synthase A